MWTKLKEKGETIFSNAGWIHREPSQGIQGKEKSSPGLAVGELTKLREKVVMARKNLFSKGKEGSEEEQVVKKEAHKVMMAVQRDTHETMSEATVCLLMDRFVPC
ncbi:hypothetical protein HKD37_20G055275 [Glycine soja]